MRLVGFVLAVLVLVVPGSASAQTPNPNPIPNVVGGTRPAPGAWPWMVFIVGVDSSGNGISSCSGELIGPTTVLTAAHCLDPTLGVASYDVSSASTNPNLGSNYVPSPPYETVSASAVVANPGYQNGGSTPYDFDDVGIIPLSAPLTGTSWLPLIQPDEVGPFATQAGFSGLTAGYGLTEGTGMVVGTLYQTEINHAVIDTYSGGETDTTGALFHYYFGGSGTCEGDSGGPLLVPVGGGTLPVTTNPSPGNGEWAVVGVVRGGDIGCMDFGDYTNVAYNVSGANDVADWLATYETPFDYVAPSISGDAVGGQTLTCKPGTWAEQTASFTYTWETVTTNGVTPINGANAQTYTSTSNDVGNQLECTVTATVAGFGSTNSATSAPVTITPPTVSVSSAAAPPLLSGSPFSAVFSGPVQGVTSADFTVNEAGYQTGLPGTVTCLGASATPVSCSAGPVITAELTPASPLIAGEYYFVLVNQAAPGIVAAADGTPVPLTQTFVRAQTQFGYAQYPVTYKWATVKQTGTLGGSYTEEESPGGTASFTAKGSSVGIVTWDGPDGGTATVTVTTPNHQTVTQSIDTYAPTAGDQTTTISGLPTGTHTVTVSVNGANDGTSTGDWVRLDATVVGGKTVATPSFTYTWPVLGTTAAYSRVKGASFTLTFRGTGVAWTAYGGPAEGKAKVTIDGATVATEDLYHNSYGPKAFTFANLSQDGFHTIVITALGTGDARAGDVFTTLMGFTVQ